MAGGVCVESCSDGPRAICRLLQAILAGLILFIGITCQFWAGMNVNDVPLSKLCDAYSGSPEAMTTTDFNELANWYENSIGCSGYRQCFNFDRASSYFMRSSGLDASRSDLMHYADAQFYCKRAPNQVSKTAGKESETCLSKMQSGATELYPCRLWPDQKTSPSDNGNWYLAGVKGERGPVYHINCYDKQEVYKSFLESVYSGVKLSTGEEWTKQDIKVAADQFLQSCVVDKGSDGYMLIIGPLVALLGAIIVTMTMFKAFSAPPWPDLGMNMLIISIILLFIGFWTIASATSEEVLNKYTYCGSNTAPLVFLGRWYDHTPCIDLTTDGKSEWHPFVSMILYFDSVYVAGGVMSFIASLMYLGLCSGFTETMMNDRMGKYLVTLQDIPMKVRLPFPPKPANGF